MPRKRAGTSATDSPSPYWYDAAAAAKAVEFFAAYLVHVKGELAGQPLVLMPWQASIVGRLFGWKRRSDGMRRYRHAFVEVPRKNSKSTLASGIALYLLLADQEPGAEIVSAAADREQAAIVFDLARSMVEANAELRHRCEIYRRAIVVPKTGSSYKVISAEAYTKHGMNLHGAIVDEVHAHPTRELHDVLATSMGARRQPLMLSITTAGWDRTSLCGELHDYTEKVLHGVIADPSFFGVIHAAADADDWRAPATWAKANPGLGQIVKLEYLEQECRRAQEVPAYENTFKRLHLNLWTASASRWLDLEKWRACGEPPVDAEALRGKPCFVGIDLGGNEALSAVAVVFRDPDGGATVLAHFWLPGDRLPDRVKHDRVPYDAWAREGLLTLTPGPTVSLQSIREHVSALRGQYDVREVCYDSWAMLGLAQQIESDGAVVVRVDQNVRQLSPACRELERLVLEKTLRHGGNPLLAWNAANVIARVDHEGNVLPGKASETSRIDGVSALLTALARVIAAPLEPPSVYETRGILTV